MGEIFGLIGLIVLLLIVLPIVATVKAANASKQVAKLTGRIARLEWALANPTKQGTELEGEAEEERPEVEATPASEIVPEARQAPPPLPIQGPAREPVPVEEERAAAVPQAKTKKERPSPFESINWEQFMGAKLFAWIGGLALFLGLGFFVKYAFERDMIPPELRVALGFASGLGLLVGGYLMDRKKYGITSHTLCATGVLVLYVTAFACRAVYHFPMFGVVPTFLLMVLITAVAFLLAMRLNSIVIAVLGLVGGFLTPVLVAPGDDPLGLFGYVALLDAGLIALSLHKRWHFLVPLAGLGTVLMEWSWALRFFAVPEAGTGLVVFLGFAVLMTGAAVLAWRRGMLSDWYLGTAAGLAGSLFFFAAHVLTFPALARGPFVFLASVFGAGICFGVLSWLRPGRPYYHAWGAAISFALLAWWAAGAAVDGAVLNWVLGACFLFAVFHSALPFVLSRLNAEFQAPRWVHALPLLAFGVILIPVFRLEELSILMWPVVLVLDVIAVIVAVLAGAVWVIAAALLLTFVALFGWTGTIASGLESMPEILVVVGGFAVAATVVTYLLRGRFAGVAGPGEDGAARAGWEKRFDIVTPHLPAVSAALPFALLMVVTARMPLVNPAPVFGLALVLVGLLLGLSYILRAGALSLVGLLSVVALQALWQEAHLGGAIEAGHAAGPLAWHLVFFALFAAWPFVFWRRYSGSLLPWITSALSGPLHFVLVHRLVSAAWPNDYMGLVPALFAIPSIAALVILIRRLPETAKERPTQLAWFGGVALLFITLIFPIQFSREWITVGWALEGAALLWLFHRVPHPGLRITGVVLLGAVFVRLAINPAVLSYHERGDFPVLNWYFYTYGIAAACFFAGARLLRAPRNEMCGIHVPPYLYGLGTVLLFLLMNIEIADFFTLPGQRVLTFEFSGNFARDMTYTIAWGLFAFLLLIVGLVRRIRGVRVAGVGLLLIALLKLFLHDLAALPNLYRIGALLATAVIAIAASFLYQKLLAEPPGPAEKGSADDDENDVGTE